MPDIESVVKLEEELAAKRKEVAAALKEARWQSRLTLEEVGREVDLNPSQVMLIEKGQSWKTSTVQRLVQFFKGGQQNSRSRARPAV